MTHDEQVRFDLEDRLQDVRNLFQHFARQPGLLTKEERAEKARAERIMNKLQHELDALKRQASTTNT